MASYADAFEFVVKNRVTVVDAYLKIALKELGRLHQPERKPPRALLFSDTGWLVVPEDWTRFEMPSVTLRVLPRGQRHFPAAMFKWSPNGPHLAQETFEQIWARQVPARLPSPFTGQIEVSLLVGGSRRWHQNIPATLDWCWPMPDPDASPERS